MPERCLSVWLPGCSRNASLRGGEARSLVVLLLLVKVVESVDLLACGLLREALLMDLCADKPAAQTAGRSSVEPGRGEMALSRNGQAWAEPANQPGSSYPNSSL